MRATQSPATWDNRDLIDWVSSRREIGNGGMARFVHGKAVTFIRLDRKRTDRSHHDLVAGFLKVIIGDGCGPSARGVDRGLVQKVFQIGTREARRAGCNGFKVFRITHRQPARVDVKNGPPRFLVR